MTPGKRAVTDYIIRYFKVFSFGIEKNFTALSCNMNFN